MRDLVAAIAGGGLVASIIDARFVALTVACVIVNLISYHLEKSDDQR